MITFNFINWDLLVSESVELTRVITCFDNCMLEPVGNGHELNEETFQMNLKYKITIKNNDNQVKERIMVS